jgi:hypothetical protein
MNDYFIETLGPGGAPRGPAATSNRFKIKQVTERKDGSHNFHVNYKGHDTTVQVDTKHIQQHRKAVFRNSEGRPVEASEVITALLST